MRNSTQIILTLAFLFCSELNLFAERWQVGPTRNFISPNQVVSKVKDGDTVEIDAGLYSGIGACAVWTQSNIVVRGAGGIAHLEAAGAYVLGKGIFVSAGNNNTFEYLEFSGASVPDKNGAGIRVDGSGIVIRHCYFHDNETGVLGPNGGDVLIEFTEFDHNGSGDGYSHNLYIGTCKSLTFRYNYSHNARIGHELKSRANINYIFYNRITTENGNASRRIDLPQGGLAIIIGNIFQQGPNTSNGNLLGYALENFNNTPPHQLYVINNTFVNQRGKNGTFIAMPSSGVDLLKAYNNIFTGSPYTFLSGVPASLDTIANLFIPNPDDVNFQNLSEYDYNLTNTSPAINKGVYPGLAGTFSLVPDKQYLHPTNFAPRVQLDSIDIGAYEFSTELSANGANEGVEIHFNTDFVNKHLNIMLPCDEIPVWIFVYNIFGNLIYSQKSENCSIVWNYNGLSKGIYMILVKTNAKQYIQKIVVAE